MSSIGLEPIKITFKIMNLVIEVVLQWFAFSGGFQCLMQGGNLVLNKRLGACIIFMPLIYFKKVRLILPKENKEEECGGEQVHPDRVDIAHPLASGILCR